MVPATILTVTVVGVTMVVPLLRAKVIPFASPIVPATGATVTIPGAVVVVVYVPEPDVALVRLSAQVVSMWSGAVAVPPDGVTVKVIGVGVAASPGGPAAPMTADDSSTRLSASVTISDAVRQPFCVTR